jgi:class 3 adenylate cyclase
MKAPETRYAKSGDENIAYQVVGKGPPDLVLVDQWFSNMEAQWEFPPLARLLTRLASFSRLILLDKRGTGLSDPVPLGALPTLEEWMDDVRAVIEAAGSERAAIVGGIGASYLAILFAATHPDRTSALVLVDGYARASQAPDYPWGIPAEVLPAQLDQVRYGWGKGILLDFVAPTAGTDPDVRNAYARYERQSASPGSARAMVQMLHESDVRHVLPTIRVPTLVIQHTEGARIGAPHGRYLAEHIDGARYVELPGRDNLIWAGDQERLIEEIQEFLTGTRPVVEPDRVLATVMFTDIVDSTVRASDIGDVRWRDLLARHDDLIRRELERHRGREVKTTGDGFLATFDGPARGVRCAQAIGSALSPLGIQIRAGLHTGEVELTGDDVRGIAVHIGARVAALAGGGEVFVSGTVKDLVAGSEIQFEDRGVHSLKGLPGEWRLFAVKG